MQLQRQRPSQVETTALLQLSGRRLRLTQKALEVTVAGFTQADSDTGFFTASSSNASSRESSKSARSLDDQSSHLRVGTSQKSSVSSFEYHAHPANVQLDLSPPALEGTGP